MKLKNLFFVGSFGLAVFFSACKKNQDSTTDTNGQDMVFVTQASMSNTAEVREGNLALTKGRDSAVKAYAQMMVMQHTMAQKNLRDTASALNMQVSDTISAMDVAMMNQLNSLSGHAFDSAYIAGQIVGHQNTATAFQSEISSGSNTRIKAFATNNFPMIQAHLVMADSIKVHLKP